jgi:hypothetical protein
MTDVNCMIKERAADQGVELSGVVWSVSRMARSYSSYLTKEGH